MAEEGGTPKVDVNLVPMIDIMFQLIAFFTMLINFDNSNRDERIRLPVADLATPSEMAMDEMLVLNVNRFGQGNVLGELIDLDDERFRKYMIRESQQALAAMKRARHEFKTIDSRPQLWTTILIRADRDAEYGKIQRTLRMCQDLGFYKFALRATADKVE